MIFLFLCGCNKASNNVFDSKDIMLLCESKTIGNNLYCNILVMNKSECNIYIPISHWLMEGSNPNNYGFQYGYLKSSSFSLILLNYYPKKYGYCWIFDMMPLPFYNYYPKVVILKPQKNIYFHVVYKTNPNIDSKIPYELRCVIPYATENRWQDLKYITKEPIDSICLIDTNELNISIQDSQSNLPYYTYIQSEKEVDYLRSRIINNMVDNFTNQANAETRSIRKKNYECSINSNLNKKMIFDSINSGQIKEIIDGFMATTLIQTFNQRLVGTCDINFKNK